MRIKSKVLIGTLLLPLPLAAANFDIHGGGGIAKYHTERSSIAISGSEIDTLGQPNSNWDNGIYQLGFSFFPGSALPVSGMYNFLQTMSFQLNGYHIADESLKGPVYRFGDPRFNDYNYRMHVRSYRLMADAVVNAFDVNNLSIYGKAGIGEAWHQVNYADYPIDGSGFSSISSRNKTRHSVAWEAGAGAQYNFTNQLGVSLEYLYMGTGKVKLGQVTSNSCVHASSPKINLDNSAFLVNLHWIFA